MVAFARQADVLEGGDTAGTVAIVEITADWRDRSLLF